MRVIVGRIMILTEAENGERKYSALPGLTSADCLTSNY